MPRQTSVRQVLRATRDASGLHGVTVELRLHLDQVIQLAAIEPDAFALGADVNLDALSRHLAHRSIVQRTSHESSLSTTVAVQGRLSTLGPDPDARSLGTRAGAPFGDTSYYQSTHGCDPGLSSSAQATASVTSGCT